MKPLISPLSKLFDLFLAFSLLLIPGLSRGESRSLILDNCDGTWSQAYARYMLDDYDFTTKIVPMSHLGGRFWALTFDEDEAIYSIKFSDGTDFPVKIANFPYRPFIFTSDPSVTPPLNAWTSDESWPEDLVFRVWNKDDVPSSVQQSDPSMGYYPQSRKLISFSLDIPAAAISDYEFRIFDGYDFISPLYAWYNSGFAANTGTGDDIFAFDAADPRAGKFGFIPQAGMKRPMACVWPKSAPSAMTCVEFTDGADISLASLASASAAPVYISMGAASGDLKTPAFPLQWNGSAYTAELYVPGGEASRISLSSGDADICFSAPAEITPESLPATISSGGSGDVLLLDNSRGVEDNMPPMQIGLTLSPAGAGNYTLQLTDMRQAPVKATANFSSDGLSGELVLNFAWKPGMLDKTIPMSDGLTAASCIRRYILAVEDEAFLHDLAADRGITDAELNRLSWLDFGDYTGDYGFRHMNAYIELSDASLLEDALTPAGATVTFRNLSPSFSGKIRLYAVPERNAFNKWWPALHFSGANEAELETVIETSSYACALAGWEIENVELTPEEQELYATAIEDGIGGSPIRFDRAARLSLDYSLPLPAEGATDITYTVADAEGTEIHTGSARTLRISNIASLEELDNLSITSTYTLAGRQRTSGAFRFDTALEQIFPAACYDHNAYVILTASSEHAAADGATVLDIAVDNCIYFNNEPADGAPAYLDLRVDPGEHNGLASAHEPLECSFTPRLIPETEIWSDGDGFSISGLQGHRDDSSLWWEAISSHNRAPFYIHHVACRNSVNEDYDDIHIQPVPVVHYPLLFSEGGVLLSSGTAAESREAGMREGESVSVLSITHKTYNQPAPQALEISKEKLAGISEIEFRPSPVQSPGMIYDLQGRSYPAGTKLGTGIYISGDKKLIIR